MFKLFTQILFLVGLVAGLASCGGGGSAGIAGNSSSGGGTALAGSNQSTSLPTGGSSLLLSWSAPIENTDNSTLSDLNGFKIYYGISATSMTNTIYVDNPNTTSYTVDNLASNTVYYFTVTAINTLGGESIASNTVNKTAS